MKVTIEGTDKEIADTLLAMGHRLKEKAVKPPTFFTNVEPKAREGTERMAVEQEIKAGTYNSRKTPQTFENMTRRLLDWANQTPQDLVSPEMVREIRKCVQALHEI